MARKKHIKKKGTDLYQRNVELPRDTNGKRRRRVVYGKTVVELDRKEQELKQQITTGMIVDPSAITVARYATEWLEQKYSKENIQVSTHLSYELVIKNHIDAHLGAIRIGKITPHHVNRMLSSMTTGSSKKRHAFTVLNQTCKQAVKLGLLARNPCESVDRPAPSKPKLKCWSLNDSKKFLIAAENNRYYALYVLAIAHGIRSGELFALEWPDIDFSNRYVMVTKTVKDKKKGLTVGPPKSSRSKRKVILSQFALDALVNHRKNSLKNGLASAQYVFCDHKGEMTKRWELRKHSFVPIMEMAKVPVIRMHDLRHTAATTLLAAGENPKVVSDLLGHSSVAFTLDTYTHVLPSMQQTTANAIDRLHNQSR